MQFFLLRMFALGSAIFLTFRVQAYYLTDDAFAMFLPMVLWMGLGVDWMVQQILRWKQKSRLERRAWLLPVGLLVVVTSGVTHAPLRVLLWTQKADLEEAERRLPTEQIRSEIRPFQVAKSKGAIRLLLWESRDLDLTSKTAFGFAHCPNDIGCTQASFYNYWDYSEGTPKYVQKPVKYYGDYSNGAPVYVALGDDWYAAKVGVKDIEF